MTHRIKPIDTPLYPHRSQAERWRDVVRVMQERPEISDRRIARIVAVSRELVSKIRHQLVRKSVIQSCHALRRVGADGKTYRRLPRRKQNDATTP